MRSERAAMRRARDRALGLVLLAAALSCGCTGTSAIWSEERGAASTGPAGSAAPAARAGATAPDILVVLVDALRPDHLGCYGYARPTSPFLDRWSAGAARYDEAFTAATHTRMSIASLFTGTRPTVHRVRSVDLESDHPDDPSLATDALSDRFTTLAESLAAAGYETWGFSANPHVSTEFGFSQGFSCWWQTSSRRGGDMIDKVEQELRSRRGAASTPPLFVYVHLMSVHNPYAPPAPWKDTFRQSEGKVVYTNGPVQVSPQDLAATIAQYDGGVRYTDSLLERLLPLWEDGAARPRVSVILSDHGEEFADHGGLGHGMSVYRELSRITLFVKSPGVPAGAQGAPVTTLDLHRLLIDLAGASAPAIAQGRPAAAWASPSEHDPVLYTESRNGWAAYREGGGEILYPRSDPARAVWFDRAKDPHESDPRTDPAAIEALRERLRPLLVEDERIANELGTPARRILGKETRESLKSLGYLGGL